MPSSSVELRRVRWSAVQLCKETPRMVNVSSILMRGAKIVLWSHVLNGVVLISVVR